MESNVWDTFSQVIQNLDNLHLNGNQEHEVDQNGENENYLPASGEIVILHAVFDVRVTKSEVLLMCDRWYFCCRITEN